MWRKSVLLAIVIVTEENDDLQAAQGVVVTGPMTICVTPGPNGVLDSPVNSLDAIGVVQGDTVIVAGSDQNCQTTARSTNLVPNFTNPNVIINADSIKNWLNRIYNKAGVNWSTVNIINAIINYDLDGDGWFDSFAQLEFNAEMEAMIERCDICKTTLNSDNFDAILFFVDNSSDEIDTKRTSFGIMTFGQRYGFIYPESATSRTQFFKTIAHELGHGIFGLRHPFDHENNPHDSPGYPKAPSLNGPFTDPGNLMDYDSRGVLIRKYHWDVIHE